MLLYSIYIRGGGKYMPTINKKNLLYVFVKGHKGRGAFEIMNSAYKSQHKDSVSKSLASPIYMDLKAIEASLKYIKDHRGENHIPQNPVIFIFTTYEVNYEVASDKKVPKKPEMIQFKKTLEKLRDEFKRPHQKQRDEIKCYWIPDNFENHIEDVKKLLKH